MRILLVTPEFPPHAGGGILKYYTVLTEALTAAGASVTVLVATPFSAHEPYTTPSGVRVAFVPLADVERHTAKLTHLTTAPMFRRWLGASLAATDVVQHTGADFDVIETTDFGLGFATLASLAERPPILVRMHGSIGQISEHEPVAAGMELDAALSRATEALLLPTAERLSAYSPANTAEWTTRLSVEVGFMPPPLPLPEPARAEPTEYTGLVAARIQAWKGPELLCRAIASLGERVPGDLKIAWAGRDTATAPDGGSLSAWLGRTFPGIWGTRVVPIGLQPADAIARLQASVRYVLVPSLWDTFNYTLAEAMAAGCVTVASTGAGASCLIEQGVNGFSFDLHDPAACAARLLDAHALDAGRRRDVGEAARATVARELHPATIAARSLAEYAALPHAPQARPTAWVREFFDPASAGDIASTAYLENASIRELARHLGQRLVRKLAR